MATSFAAAVVVRARVSNGASFPFLRFGETVGSAQERSGSLLETLCATSVHPLHCKNLYQA